MLRLVFGRAGSGKTAFTLEKADEIARMGGEAVVIVPEQFTFETERVLTGKYGPQTCLNIEVLSFSRLCERVFSLAGGLSRKYIDDSGRCILMQLALRQVSDMLEIYTRQTENPAFVKTMVETVTEYKMGGISGEMLEDAAKKTDDSLLKEKLSDISLIYETYTALLENGFADSLDDLTRLAKKLDEYDFFGGKTVLIDSFKGFTAQEKSVLKRIFRQAEDVYITLCADYERRGDEQIGLFSPVLSTARQLSVLVKQADAALGKPIVLNETRRFESLCLKALEEKIFRPGMESYDGPAEEIHILSASNVYDEAQAVAQEIKKLVRETGCRYRDIVVIARSLGHYEGILDPIFEKYEIPLFFDSRRSVESHPLMAMTLSAVDLIESGFRQEQVFKYLKTGLAGIDVEETALLENYVLMWDIKGRAAWESKWENNPEGFKGSLTGQNREDLDRINQIKSRFLDSILEFKREMDAAGTASEKSAALYRFLEKMKVGQAVSKTCGELLDAGETGLADEYRQIYEKLISLIDQLALTIGAKKLTTGEFSRLLHLIIANADLGHIPPSLDQVTAGDADRIRAGEAKYAFVIGLAEGMFPQSPFSGGILSDSERKKLIELGLELSAPAQEKSVEERFLAYKAYTSASRAVYLTCPRSNAAGKALRPSYYLSGVSKLFPRCDKREEALFDPLESAQNEASAFELMAVRYREQSAMTRAIARFFSEKPEYERRMAVLERAADKTPFTFRDVTNARALFGERMQISPSRLETFRQCRFLYYCRYGLRAFPRGRAEMDAPEIGTLIHFVLERLLREHNGKGLWTIARDELSSQVKNLLKEFADGFLGGLKDKPERFKYLYLRLEGQVIGLIEHIARELEQSMFRPVDFELTIGRDVKPLTVDLPDGGSITVEGKVDRVDLMKRDGASYLRVVDYKTGSKEFNLSDVIYGLNLQMFLYLFALCDNGGGRYSAQGEITPAGVLYVPSGRPNITAARSAGEEDISAARDSAYKMSGLLLDDPEVIRAMERDGSGVFIPAKLRKSEDADGNVSYEPDSRASVASLEKFGFLKRHVVKTLKDMALTLREGDVAAEPVQGISYHPCDYCDYACVCGHEPGDGIRLLRKYDKEEVWKSLKEEGGVENV